MHPEEMEPSAGRRDPEGVPGWFRRAPVERLTLPAAGCAWTAADILHAVGASPVWPAGFAVVAAWAGYRHTARAVKRMTAHQGHNPKRNYPADTAAVIGTAGGWVAVATAWGATGMLGWVWLGVSLGGWVWIRFRHPGVAHARSWRARKRAWLGQAPLFGLHGAHLTGHRQTRLGEWFRLDTRGTGRRASSLAGVHTAERIAEQERLPVSRVLVTTGALAGELEVSVRYRDPWEHVVPHPLLDPDPEIQLTVGGSILDPAVIGIDPESGEPLAIRLYDPDLGGRRILIVGTTRYAGKTVKQNCLRERVTAMRDAVLFDINLSKAIEDRAWAPACHLTAIGAQQVGRAQKIMDLLVAVIDIRPSLRDHAVFRPGIDGPAIVLDIDEVDTAVPYIKRQLRDVMSKGGSEGITVIEAGQRGIGDWVGGRDIRPLIDVVCVGKVTRPREQQHAAGPLATVLPDMTSYGGGALGVWGIAELDGTAQSGRTFRLDEPDDLARIAQARARSQPVLEPGLVAALRERFGDLYDDLLGSDAFAAWAAGYPPVTSDEPTPPPPAGDTPPPGDDLEEWPVHDSEFPADPASRRAMLAGKLADAHRMTGQADAIAARLASASPEEVRETAERQWKKAEAATPLPEDARAQLLDLAASGTTSRAAAQALGVPPSRALMWLHRLKDEGLIHLEGSGRGSRWVTGGGGDSQSPVNA